ncbi:MAG: penicillin-binding protein activator LpoB [Candidatus Cloacimonetes bacterium]|nr:penicillin-binding protein activator LpoB [Candidatus Cloacimonadota bacterium]
MNNKTIFYAIVLSMLVTLTIGCASTNNTPTPTPSQADERNQLDQVIRRASDYLNDFLRDERGATIVIIAAHPNFWGLSNYIINGLSRNAVNDRTFRVADRTQLGDVEILFQQNSGRVSDETLLSLTRVTGASVYFAIDITRTRNEYTFNLRAVDIETQVLAGHEIFVFESTQFIDDLSYRDPNAPIYAIVSVRGDQDGRIEKAFTEVLNSNGIRSIQSGTDLYSLNASLELQDVDSDDPRFAYVRYILNYSFRLPSNAEVFSKTISDRVQHRNTPEARNRAIQMVEHFIRSDGFSTDLTNNISRL